MFFPRKQTAGDVNVPSVECCASFFLLLEKKKKKKKQVTYFTATALSLELQRDVCV